MAVRNGTSEWNDYLGRTTNVPAFNAAFTLMSWFRIVTNPASYSWADLLSIRSEPAGTFYHEEIGAYYIPGTGVQLYVRANNNGAVADGLGDAVLSTNTWYCVAFVRAASDGDRKIYLGSLSSLIAQDGSTITATTGTFGTPSAFLGVAEARSGVVRIGNTKIWTAALTLAQLQAEQYIMRPVEFTSLNAWLPFLNIGATRGKDYAGNGDLTTNGTMTDEDNPPVSYGAMSLIPRRVAAPSGVTVTPAPAAATSAGVDPTVVHGAISITPAVVSATSSGVDPTVVLGAISITPTTADVVSSGVDPVVIHGAVAIAPASADSTSSGVDPAVVLGATTAAPASADAVSNGVDPTVLMGGITIAPAAAVATSSGVDPTVVLGAITVAPATADAVSSGVDPTVVIALVITPASADVTASGVDPSVVYGPVTIIPAAATVTASGVDPAVVYGAVTITPLPADALASGVDPVVFLGGVIISPAAAVVTGSGVDPVVVYGPVTIVPVAAESLSSGVDPTVIYGATTATPLPAYATATGVDPLVTEGGLPITITPGPAEVFATLAGPVVVVGEPAFINGLHDRVRVSNGGRGIINSAIGVIVE